MAKHVTVAVRMDSEFVRLLNANVHLSGLRDKDELQPIDQLALSILAEARGGYEAEVHQTILHCWRPHFEVLSEMRKVEEVSAGEHKVIDHLDGHPLNNDPSNLRVVTLKEAYSWMPPDPRGFTAVRTIQQCSNLTDALDLVARTLGVERKRERKVMSVVHWKGAQWRGSLRVYCGTLITPRMAHTMDKTKVNCQRCIKCMKLHEHLPTL